MRQLPVAQLSGSRIWHLRGPLPLPPALHPTRRGAENLGLGLLAAGCIAGIVLLGRAG